MSLSLGGKLLMENTLYHNPPCSKSLKALEIIREYKAKIRVVEYLKTPPSLAELRFICDAFNGPPIQLFRVKEKFFSDLGLYPQQERSREYWLSFLCGYPILLECLILIYNSRVIIARPPEKT